MTGKCCRWSKGSPRLLRANKFFSSTNSGEKVLNAAVPKSDNQRRYSNAEKMSAVRRRPQRVSVRRFTALQYVPSSLTRGLRQRAGRTIGVCLPNPLDPDVSFGFSFLERIWRGIVQAADLADYALLHYPVSVRESGSAMRFWTVVWMEFSSADRTMRGRNSSPPPACRRS